MKSLRTVALAACLATATCVSGAAQQREAERPSGGVVDFLAPVEADPLIQHSKEVYVKNGCAYCHGVDLKVRNGEAADLLHSAIVGGDVDANIIGPLLRNGIPQTAKLSPMPQFKDLSDRNLVDLARWIHYSRQRSRFDELKVSDRTPADATAGRAAFQQGCASCHSAANISAMVKKYPAEQLRIRMLRPASLNTVQSFTVQALHDQAMIQARRQHGTFLENATQSSVANLTGYLSTLR